MLSVYGIIIIKFQCFDSLIKDLKERKTNVAFLVVNKKISEMLEHCCDCKIEIYKTELEFNASLPGKTLFVLSICIV